MLAFSTHVGSSQNVAEQNMYLLVTRPVNSSPASSFRPRRHSHTHRYLSGEKHSRLFAIFFITAPQKKYKSRCFEKPSQGAGDCCWKDHSSVHHKETQETWSPYHINDRIWCELRCCIWEIVNQKWWIRVLCVWKVWSSSHCFLLAAWTI